jgi:hypothetical protein
MYNIILTVIDLLSGNTITKTFNDVTLKHRDYIYHDEIGNYSTVTTCNNSGKEMKEVPEFTIISGSTDSSCTAFTWIEYKI